MTDRLTLASADSDGENGAKNEVDSLDCRFRTQSERSADQMDRRRTMESVGEEDEAAEIICEPGGTVDDAVNARELMKMFSPSPSPSPLSTPVSQNRKSLLQEKTSSGPSCGSPSSGLRKRAYSMGNTTDLPSLISPSSKDSIEIPSLNLGGSQSAKMIRRVQSFTEVDLRASSR